MPSSPDPTNPLTGKKGPVTTLANAQDLCVLEICSSKAGSNQHQRSLPLLPVALAFLPISRRPVLCKYSATEKVAMSTDLCCPWTQDSEVRQRG